MSCCEDYRRDRDVPLPRCQPEPHIPRGKWRWSTVDGGYCRRLNNRTLSVEHLVSTHADIKNKTHREVSIA